jgi:membrane-associated phospholipid phosphatase
VPGGIGYACPPVSPVFQELAVWDRLATQLSQSLHWGPATAAFLLMSAWWVKGPLLVGFGACADLRCRRRFVPLAGTAGTIAVLLGSVLSGGIKELVDRSRPAAADPDVTAIGGLPDTPSFPSGHATTAFAAAAAVGLFYPRLRLPLFAVAALVGLSRIYLGVHYTLDVIAGAALGIVLGLSVAWATKRLASRC